MNLPDIVAVAFTIAWTLAMLSLDKKPKRNTTLGKWMAFHGSVKRV